VTGGFARSVVNFDAGAETPAPAPSPPWASRWRRCPDAASLLPAQGDAGRDDHRRGAEPRRLLDPEAHLAYSAKADFAAVAATILLTLVLGVEDRA
jgi:hypothetical protein